MAATAAAEPPDEPPGVSGVFAPLRRHGEITGPKCEVSFDEPMAMKKRADAVTDGGIAGDIVKNAPASEGNFFLVPKVVE